MSEEIILPLEERLQSVNTPLHRDALLAQLTYRQYSVRGQSFVQFLYDDNVNRPNISNDIKSALNLYAETIPDFNEKLSSLIYRNELETVYHGAIALGKPINHFVGEIFSRLMNVERAYFLAGVASYTELSESEQEIKEQSGHQQKDGDAVNPKDKKTKEKQPKQPSLKELIAKPLPEKNLTQIVWDYIKKGIDEIHTSHMIAFNTKKYSHGLKLPLSDLYHKENRPEGNVSQSRYSGDVMRFAQGLAEHNIDESLIHDMTLDKIAYLGLIFGDDVVLPYASSLIANERAARVLNRHSKTDFERLYYPFMKLLHLENNNPEFGERVGIFLDSTSPEDLVLLSKQFGEKKLGEYFRHYFDINLARHDSLSKTEDYSLDLLTE